MNIISCILIEHNSTWDSAHREDRRSQEVDFIAEQAPKKLYVQVAFKLESEETVQREFSPLLSIRDSYPKFVVTMDPHFQDTIEGVRHIGLYQFLTDEYLFKMVYFTTDLCYSRKP